jgi:DNA polymerase-3 subunit alpha
MCEWLVDQGIEFEMHKALANGRMCDFYFDGVYWEMDGMDRSPEFFAAKYGDLPYVVVTPEDFRFRVERHMATAHAENGDPVVAIEPVGEVMTYDVEMSADGPLNFMANGIVSHNSHAACYALISYRTAWLKANYPSEYMAALISSVMDTKDKVPFFVNQTEAMGIEILPPDVNESDHEFMVVEGNIRFGLDAVKGVGFQAVEAIKRAREEDGDFSSLWDFCERVDCRTVNKRAIEALIKCGAFGSTEATRRGMLEVLDAAQGAGQKAQQDAAIGQGSIFDLGGFGDAAPAFSAPAHPPVPTHEFERPELLAMEKESIGVFITEHPLKRVSEALKLKTDCAIAEIPERRDGEWVKVGGMITEAKKIRTRSGSTMMFATLDDLEGTTEVVVFEKALSAAEGVLQTDEIVLVKGRVDHKDANKVCIVVQDVTRFEPSEAEIEKARNAMAEKLANEKPSHLKRRVDAARLEATIISDLRDLFERYPGKDDFLLEMETRAGVRRLRFGGEYRIAARNGALRAELDALLGEARIDEAPVVTAPELEPAAA